MRKLETAMINKFHRCFNGFWSRESLVFMVLCMFVGTGIADDGMNQVSKAIEPQKSGRAFFEANVGQLDPWVKYAMRGGDYPVFIAPGKLEVVLPSEDKHIGKLDCSEIKAAACQSAVLQFTFVSGRDVAVKGENPVSTHVHYYLGKNPKQWFLNVPAFQDVVQDEVYPGIGVLYHGNGSRLEYQFLVDPGADPGQIRVHVAGVKQLALSPSGDLILDSGGSMGQTTLRSPVAFQSDEHCRQPISVKYKLLGKSDFAFALAPFDHKKVLTIDPLLVYSTFFNLAWTDTAFSGVAAGPDGSMYGVGVHGWALGYNAGPVMLRLNNDGTYGYVTAFSNDKFNLPLGPTAVAVDSQNNAYIVGQTQGDSLAIVDSGTVQPIFPGGLSVGFIAKFASDGTLTESTYLGGSQNLGVSFASAIAVDNAAEQGIYVAGGTSDPGFPSIGGQQNSGITGPPGGFVVKLDASLHRFYYTSFFPNIQSVCGVAIDASGAAYAAGAVAQVGCVRSPGNSPTKSAGAAVLKLSPDGSTLVYSQVLHGSGSDYATGIAIDPDGDAYVVGTTNSPDFPVTRTTKPFQPSFGGTGLSLYGSGDAFVAKFDPNGTLWRATFLGGSDDEIGAGIAVDGAGNPYVIGTTASTDFPSPANLALSTSHCALEKGAYPQTPFVAGFDRSLSKILYSTCLGGSTGEGASIAWLSGGTVLTGGRTGDPIFPVTPDALHKDGPGTFCGLGVNGGCVKESGFLSEISSCSYPVQFWSQADGLHLDATKQLHWATDTYDGYANNTGNTIRRWGCALTSLAMALNYAGLNQVPDSSGNLVSLDPGTLNEFLDCKRKTKPI